jgi:hypothetical protein
MLSCRRGLLPIFSIRKKGLWDFPEARDRETGGTEQGIFAAKQGFGEAHSRFSSRANRNALYHAIVAIFTAVRAAALAMMMRPGKGADAPQPDDTVA